MIIRDKSFYRTFFGFFLVLVFQNIIRFAVNLTDNVMLGSYSEAALAGATAVNHLQFVLQQAIMGIGNGLVILGTQYWGQNRPEPPPLVDRHVVRRCFRCDPLPCHLALSASADAALHLR